MDNIPYPRLTIDTAKLRENARAVAELCARHGIDVWGVTKGLSGDPRLAQIYVDAGFKGVADSRLRNLRGIRDAGVPARLQLMRIAMPSEADDLVRIADASLQSEVSTILRLDEIAFNAGRTHEVLLMIDIGDLREGFWPKELVHIAEPLRGLKGGVKIVGVATNFACASGVLPTRQKFEDLVGYRDEIQKFLGTPMPVVSVGGTCCLKIVEESGVPEGVNQLRLCEGVVTGMDTAFAREIPYLHRDVLTLSAEVVECREKPSVPEGEIGMQAFGEKPVFMDRGKRRRALLGIGRQDVNVDRIKPLESGVHIVTASSDHLIVDVTEAEANEPGKRFQPGDILNFRPSYPAMLALSTSRYVAVSYE